MKHIGIFLTCLSLLPSISFSQKYIGSDANQRVKDTRELYYKDRNSTPSFIRINSGKILDLNKWCKEHLDLNSNTYLIKTSTSTDADGTIHEFYQQFSGDYKVEFGGYSVHNNETISGTLFPAEATDPAISKNKALELAISHIGAEKYAWDAESNNHIHHQDHDEFPDGELVILPPFPGSKNVKSRLCYKFDIYANKPLYHSDIYIDAISGEVLFENNKICTADVTGNAQTLYSGLQTITTDSTGPGAYRLRDSARGVETYDMNQGTNYGSAIDFTDNDNFWNNVNPQFDHAATDAHWGAQRTYDYFNVNFGRNSIDDAGFVLRSYVHFDANYNNAFWDGTRMTYGDGSSGTNPLVALDVCGHEIAHGLTSFEANLVYSYESGALNESFSDIFGTAIEFYGKPATGNYLIGEDLGVAFRSMADPNVAGDPDTYRGNFWVFGYEDNGGVHTNSGVMNYWFYLLCEGGAGTNDKGDSFSVDSIGISDAAAIAYRNLTVYLTPLSNYADARFFSIVSAVDLYGACSPQVQAVTNAWYAVGVGEPYTNAVDANFDVDVASSCVTPYAAEFKNLSQNGNSFHWNFGDGDTSVAIEPTHTYNSYGSFDVTLIADGGLCGVDTTAKTGFIVVDSTTDCIVWIPDTTTVATTQTTCSGRLFDSGGPDNNYPDQEDVVITIDPNNGSEVRLINHFFDVEPGDAGYCNYDHIGIYDGPDTTAPRIGWYCETTGIPDTLVSTNGSLTIQQFSDQALNLRGFEFEWQCITPDKKPKADFNPSVNYSCDGIVQFYDISSNSPNAWQWTFGDGGSSTDQHPVHSYLSDGNYTVSLIATNALGSDTISYDSLITIGLPSITFTDDDTVCLNESATLKALGIGTIEWYDAPAGGNLLASDTIFNTPLINSTTSYYVTARTDSDTLDLGPIDNSFGGGGSFTGDQHLLMDAHKDLYIRTADLFAFNSGNRILELRDSNGTMIQDTTINLSAGWNTVDLNFFVPAGTNYQLGTQNGSSPNLYRNNQNADYPYELDGIATITGNSATEPAFYYFYYHLKIQAARCESPRIQVDAVVNCPAGFTNDEFDFVLYPNPANEKVSVLMPSNTGANLSYTVYTNTGTVIETGELDNSLEIELSKFSAGVYFLELSSDQFSRINKLVILTE